jgi:alcohol dehydrogenase
MLGAAHALANPLTATFHIPHGKAISLMLPHVIRFNAETVADWYNDLLEDTGGIEGFPLPDDGAEGLACFVADLSRKAGLKERLSDCGVTPGSLTEMAAQAAKQWTGTFNPRPVTAVELLEIYRRAL